MAYNGVMNMRNLILFLLLAVTANAQTIKDGSIVPRMNNIANYGPSDIKNLQIYTSVNANALTIGVYGTDTGAAPTTLKPVEIIFRNGSDSTGNYVKRQITAATTLVVPSGTTLGTANGVEAALWIYAIDNDGTVELGVSQFSIVDTSLLVSSTAISGGATAGVLYSTSARTSKPARLIGKILSTQATAGTWATNPSTYQIGKFNTYVRPTFTRYTSGSGTYTTPKNVKYLIVKAVGGGGGGSGSGLDSGGGGNGSAGGATTFGSSLITASGGSAGTWTSGGVGGGGTTVNSPAIVIYAVTGGGSGSSQSSAVNNVVLAGGAGGNSCMGGGGNASYNAVAGGNGVANTGGGGAGGGGLLTASSQHAGTGGSAGGCLEALINNPSATYSYAVGGGGGKGTAGSSGGTGGDGGSGVLIIGEYYQ